MAEEDQNSGSTNDSGSKLYALLARLPFPRSYLGKIMLSAFLGTHVPLLALLLYLVFAASTDWRTFLDVFVIVLVATLLGTGLTFYALYALLRPVSLASKALCDYLNSGSMPSLPTNFTDQAGRLMSNVQYVVQQLDQVIHSLQQSATIDYTTGIYNRRAGEQRLTSDLARIGRGEGNLTLAVVDLDTFKSINDRYGHQVGDTCLRHFANTCVRNIREGDWLARWGGDEFVLALWEEGGKQPANVVLNRFAKDLSESPVQLPKGDKILLTFSAGVFQCAGSGQVEQGIGDVLALADKALYKAKKEKNKNTLVYAR